jgi:hypothetical protein
MTKTAVADVILDRVSAMLRPAKRSKGKSERQSS